ALRGCNQRGQGMIACCHGGLARHRGPPGGWATVLRGLLGVPISLLSVLAHYLQVLTCCLAPRVFVAGAARQEGPGVWRAGEDHPTGHYVSRAGLHDPVGPSASAGAHGPISVNGANGAGTSTDTSVRTGAGAGGCAGSVSRLQ